MRVPRFEDDGGDAGTLFENWWETVVCRLAEANGWTTKRYAKWSVIDGKGVDFRMVAPDGEIYLIDTAITASHKYDREGKLTDTLVTCAMVRALDDDIANLQWLLGEAQLYWRSLCAM